MSPMSRPTPSKKGGGDESTSLGDIFKQRRAAAAANAAAANATAANAAAANVAAASNANTTQKPSGKASFLDIQREQMQQQQQQQQRQQPWQQSQQQSQQQRQQQQRQQQWQRSQQPQSQQQTQQQPPKILSRRGSNDRDDNMASRGGFGTARSGRDSGRSDRLDRGERGGGGERGVGGGDRGGGGRSNRSDSRMDRSDLPLEQGVIHTLLDKYGFILCADRDMEIFFHYSEFRGGRNAGNARSAVRVEELKIGDEVEFRVGKAMSPGGGGGAGGAGSGSSSIGGSDDKPDKLAAFEVKLLSPGTIFWEKEEEPVGKRWKGKVEQADGGGGRGGGGGGGGGEYGRKNSSSSASPSGEGIIRLVPPEDESEKEENALQKLQHVDIFFTSADYTPTSSSSNRLGNLGKADLVEFTLVTERRTGKKYARNITLLRSQRDVIKEEKERLKKEREAKLEKLLEGASLERGIVVKIGGKVGGKKGGKSAGKAGKAVGDYGFIRSANRLEEIYFHVSNVLVDEGEDRDSRFLTEGQEVEFYVVDEESSAGSSTQSTQSKLSARKIRPLPKGSVQFEKVIARGVTGVVKECPEPVGESAFGMSGVFRGGSDRGGSGGGGGGAAIPTSFSKIRLQEPITFSGFENGKDTNDKEVKEVLLHQDHYPGGTYALSRDGSQLGIWIRPGDVLLFDVVQLLSDGTYRAVPTECTTKATTKNTTDATGATDTAECVEEETKVKLPKPAVRAIRLIEPSLLGRAQGTIRSLRDNYGFIHCAERNVDAYFPLFEVFSLEMHGDLVRNDPDVYGMSDQVDDSTGEKDEKDFSIVQKGGRIHVEVGMEVSFDLSLQAVTTHNVANAGGRGSRGGRNAHNAHNSLASQEKESLRARRIQILPKSTDKDSIVLAMGVKATVTKDDPKQPFVGTLELEETFVTPTTELHQLRHPVISKLLDDIARGRYAGCGECGESGGKGIHGEAEEEEVTFHDVWSDKDLQVVISMINAREDLDWKYVPLSGHSVEDSHNRKLCITRKSKDLKLHAESTLSSENVANASPSSERLEADAARHQESESANGDSNISSEATATSERPESSHKKRGKKEKVVKSLRFDKSSFPDVSNSAPLVVGDIICCDLALSRRSGAIVVENISVVERKERGSPAVSPVSAAVVSGAAGTSEGDDHSLTEKKGATSPTETTPTTQTAQTKPARGFITELVPARQFGFITAVDDHGSKTGEHVFFHYREISSKDDEYVKNADDVGPTAQAAQDLSSPPSSARNRKATRGGGSGDVIRKGDEVTFDMGPGKNGKMNATNICILPRGTLPTKGENTTCLGYVLLEPSHTSLANTPSHIVLHSGPPVDGAGRWDKVGREDSSHAAAAAAAASKSGSNVKEEGMILLLSDPSHLFSRKPKNLRNEKNVSNHRPDHDKPDKPDKPEESSEVERDDVVQPAASHESTETASNHGNEAEDHVAVVESLVGTHLRYKLNSMALRGHAAGISSNRPEGPRRGDLVSFGKSKSGKTVKDIRIEKMDAATTIRGTLVDILKEKNTALFVSSENDAKYELLLSEVISCDKSLLREKEPVDGILHEGRIFGVCRTKDLFLTSSIGRSSSGSSSGMKERRKLNLTVKKELQGMGGQIMAQSRMAKGPDGTNGFAPGWTKRLSPFAKVFVPTFEPSSVEVTH